MEIKVNFLDNLRIEAKFDDFTVIVDHPIRYKGDGSAPSPFDYFLPSSAMGAAYFVQVYSVAPNIPTYHIRLSDTYIVGDVCRLFRQSLLRCPQYSDGAYSFITKQHRRS